MRALFIAEGSGGHLIPALETAALLARRGVQVTVWYAQRERARELTQALVGPMAALGVEIEPIDVSRTSTLAGKLRCGGRVWRQARRCMASRPPELVVGFGGWISIPVLAAARWGRQARARRACMLHEQNVRLGRTNRWLRRWVDRVAVSFDETRGAVGPAKAVVTGLPIRSAIGRCSRVEAAQRLGIHPERQTLLVLGGSQGARALNRLMIRLVLDWSAQEKREWQVVHVTGTSDNEFVAAGYAAVGIRSWVAPFLSDMAWAYAAADVVLARAGASTIAELASCGKPALFIPYPFAGAHQRANAAMVEARGGGVMIEEAQATPERVMSVLRRLFNDQRLHQVMSRQMRGLACPDAAARLAEAMLHLAEQQSMRHEAHESRRDEVEASRLG